MKRNGFSLIELMVVITILMILAAVIAPRIPKFVKLAYTGRYVEQRLQHGMTTTEADKFKNWVRERVDSLTIDNEKDVAKVYASYLSRSNASPVQEATPVVEKVEEPAISHLEKVWEESFDEGTVAKWKDKDTGLFIYISVSADGQISGISCEGR